MIYEKGKVTPELIERLGYVPYNFDNLDKTGANIRIVYGQRSNGKSFGLKQEFFDYYFNHNKQFFLIKKRHRQCNQSKMQNYFNDCDNEIYNAVRTKFPGYVNYNIRAYKNAFELIGIDDTNKKTMLDTMGYYCSVEHSEDIKSLSYPKVSVIGYDEFMSQDGGDLYDEAGKFIDMIATIQRTRTDVVVYLVGNTVDRNSTILNTLCGFPPDKIKQGELKVIDKYSQDKKRISRTIAINHCVTEMSEKVQDLYSYGTSREKMILNGEWITDSYPKFDEVDLSNIVFGFVFEYSIKRLYAYLGKDNKIYVTDERLPISRIEYITLTTGQSNFRYKIFNSNCGLEKIEKIKNNMMMFYNNGFILFKNDFVGDDFKQFLLEANI